ncbi:hypothetical protein CHS0354_012970 [Potamilus streckersoni]|uniref:Uncharacterized protein n=1 Tax=Potamilus streckersoni TaxID=2493646 RepID=A0AAE0VHC1_9BIVA|nr:hypothetical protein CHS0354_012970 [Potamilus streckersoni]
MKLILVFLAVLSLVLAGTMDEKRFLEFLHISDLVDKLTGAVHSGMGHKGCVCICKAIAGPLDILCDSACTKVVGSLPTA